MRIDALRSSALLALAIWCLAVPLASARHHAAHHEGAAPGQFDYYLLTLSWSPTYCLTHPDDRPQCGGRGYAFVLHGLWPQFESGGYPEHCAMNAPLSAAAQSVGSTIYPSPALMRHEWQAHGSCTGLDAIGYFRLEDRAMAVIRTPPLLEAPRSTMQLSAAQLIAQFRAVNPALPANGIAIACGRGELSEVRICLTRDLKPRACGAGIHSTCPASPVEVPVAR